MFHLIKKMQTLMNFCIEIVNSWDGETVEIRTVLQWYVLLYVNIFLIYFIVLYGKLFLRNKLEGGAWLITVMWPIPIDLTIQFGYYFFSKIFATCDNETLG